MNGYGQHDKLKIINDDIELYLNMKRYKDMLSNMRHGIEYMVSFMISKKEPSSIYDDLYTKIERLRLRGDIERTRASVFHTIRRLANSGGSHLEKMVGEEIVAAYAPYMREVEYFLKEYGSNIIENDQMQTITLVGKYAPTKSNIETLSPAFIYTTCRRGIQIATEELCGKEIKVVGNIGKIFGTRFNIEGISEGKNVFVAVEGLSNIEKESGERITIIGEWTPPTVASLQFGNAGTIKETKRE